MDNFADDEDEESLPKKAYVEGFNGPKRKRPEKDIIEDAFLDYIDSPGDDEDEVTEADLSKRGRRIIKEEFDE